MPEIITKGRTVKISGLPIIRVPKGKVALICNFHIINKDIVKHGEISLHKGYETMLDIRNCKFE